MDEKLTYYFANHEPVFDLKNTMLYSCEKNAKWVRDTINKSQGRNSYNVYKITFTDYHIEEIKQ